MIRTFIGWAAVGVMIASTPQAIARAGPHPAHRSVRAIPFSAGGTPVAKCAHDVVPTVAAIMRVRLFDPIDEVFKPQPGRSVKYQTTAIDNEDDDGIFDNNSTDNVWSPHLPVGEMEPYDIDLTTPQIVVRAVGFDKQVA